jgi:hypothetical protein
LARRALIRSVPAFPEEWRAGARHSKHTLDNSVDLPTQNDGAVAVSVVDVDTLRRAHTARDGRGGASLTVHRTRSCWASSNNGDKYGSPLDSVLERRIARDTERASPPFGGRSR